VAIHRCADRSPGSCRRPAEDFEPWRSGDQRGPNCRRPGGYVVRDANGQALAYVYSRDNEDEARQAKVLTKDEARRIAVNIARLPKLLGKPESD
jgi:hypothetical protein